MIKEKRKGVKPVPDDINDYLNNAQLVELNIMAAFGWRLEYIRRPLFQEPVVVMANENGGSIGILEEDGHLNLEPNIAMREC